jgi:hypothetical protein
MNDKRRKKAGKMGDSVLVSKDANVTFSLNLLNPYSYKGRIIFTSL